MARHTPTKTYTYGKTDPRQQYDVYAPKNAQGLPVIFHDHGGGWRRGDKAYPQVVDNKVDAFLPEGFIFISNNYPLGIDTDPPVDPYTMARNCANALAHAQSNARMFGGDPNRFILMGHSAGAHLTSLLHTARELARNAGARPWLGSVLIDSAAYNVLDIMEKPHVPLYDMAFGTNRSFWRKVSPLQRMEGKTAPLLVMYSEQRGEGDMDHAVEFHEVALKYGTDSRILPVDLSHGEMNSLLGSPEQPQYTKRVIDWMKEHSRRR